MIRLIRVSLFILMLAFVSGFADCYKPVTKNQLPARIKTVAVPAFQTESQALRYKVESRFTEAVMRELVHRGRGLRVQGDRDGADAVIEGVIKSFNFGGVLLDDKGRARIFEVTIVAAVTVRDQTENRVLYDNQNFVFRGEYEFSSDPRSFYNEEDPSHSSHVTQFRREYRVDTYQRGPNAKEMKTLTRTDLERSLREGPRPLYLLLGCEVFLRRVAAQSITDAALSRTLLREFNESSFSLLSDAVQSAIAAADQLPMMSDTRVVRVRDFAKIREADEDILIRYLNNPSPSTVMIFTADELDKRKKSSKVLLDTCTVVEFSTLKDAEAKAWAKTRLKELKIAADDSVLSEIIRLVGTDVQTLSNELEKLASAAAGTDRITLNHVDELIGRSRELSNFELGDHLLAGNRKRALETLHRLLEDGAEPVMLVGLIAGNYHRLALGKHLLARGGRDEVFRNINLPPFKRDSYISTLQRSTGEKIARGIQLISAVDLAIKTSQATPRLQLELLVCELAK